MIELFLPTTRHIPAIPILLDVVDVNIPALLGLDVLDGNNIFVDNVTGHLRSRITTSKDPPQYEDRWRTKLIRHGEHLYVPLHASIQSFYTKGQLRKLHKNFAQPSVIKLYDLLKTS